MCGRILVGCKVISCVAKHSVWSDVLDVMVRCLGMLMALSWVVELWYCCIVCVWDEHSECAVAVVVDMGVFICIIACVDSFSLS